MSIFKASDYARKPEPIRKTKLPTKYRTKPHKCSQCNSTNASKYAILDTNEVRWLCPTHLELYKRKHIVEKPNFVKASKLYIK